MKRTSVVGPIFLMIISAFVVAAGFKLLLIPVQLLSSGLSGVAMVIGYASGLNIGWLYFALNLPILYWGYRVLGKRFILLSITAVFSIVFFMQTIPPIVVTTDRLLASVFGGVLVGIGSALTLRYGGSSGGFDIVASIISRYRDYPIGLIVILLNLLVVTALGILQEDWNAALYSMLSIYLTGWIIDTIHTPHNKLTAFIVTTQTEAMAARLMSLPRGVTILKTKGAFTNVERDMLMTVASKYELDELRKIIIEIDPKAFVNVVQTIGVIGEFRKRFH